MGGSNNVRFQKKSNYMSFKIIHAQVITLKLRLKSRGVKIRRDL